MDIVLILEQYVRRWAITSNIGRTNIGIIGWSKTIVASNSALIPCTALEQLNQQRVFVVLLTNYDTISILAAQWAKQSLSWNNGKLFCNDSQISKH